MSIRECPRCNLPLNSEVRRIHHKNPNSAWNKSHPCNPMIGGVLAPSDVEFLVCPLCKWDCRAYEYDEAISEFWMWERISKRIHGPQL